MPVPPDRPCTKRDSEALPFRGLSHRGSHSGGGETPVSVWRVIERLAADWEFPGKIIVFSFDAGIVASLSIWYDDCRRALESP